MPFWFSSDDIFVLGLVKSIWCVPALSCSRHEGNRIESLRVNLWKLNLDFYIKLVVQFKNIESRGIHKLLKNLIQNCDELSCHLSLWINIMNNQMDHSESQITAFNGQPELH